MPRGGLLLGASVFLAYLSLLCPGLYWRDAGELSASAFGLGVAHPTGFPVYLLLAKAATFLPFGSIAFRVNLLSAAAGAATVVMAFRLGVTLCGDDRPATRAAAAAAALLLGLGQTVWLHATTAEVYLPNLLAVAVLLRLHLLALSTGSARALRAAAVLTGLGAGLHVSFLVVAAVSWLVVLAARRTPRDVGWSAALCLLGALALAYLPLRAAQDPWRNWGDPSSLGRFLSHVTGASIRDSFSGDIGSAQHFLPNLAKALSQLRGALSWAALLCAAGLVLLARRERRLGLLLLLIFLADLGFTVLINPMGMQDRQTGVIAVLAATLAAAVALAWVGRGVAAGFPGSAWVGAAMTFIAGVGLATPAMLEAGADRDSRRLYMPTDLADLALDGALPRALLLVSSDDLASTTTYLQGVENGRPDVLTVVKQHVRDTDYLQRLADSDGDGRVTAAFVRASRDGATPLALLSLLVDRVAARLPVYWELGDRTVDGVVRTALRPGFPVGRLFGPPMRGPQDLVIGARLRWHALARGRMPASARDALAQSFTLLATHLALAGETEEALWTAAEAWGTARENPAAASNFGVMLLEAAQRAERDGAVAERAGDKGRAAERRLRAGEYWAQADNRLTEALALRPESARSWMNLGKLLFKDGAGELAPTAEAFGHAAELGVSTAQAAEMLYFLAVLHANHGDRALALGLLVRGLPALEGRLLRDAERMARTLAAEVSASPP